MTGLNDGDDGYGLCGVMWGYDGSDEDGEREDDVLASVSEDLVGVVLKKEDGC